MTFLFKLIVMTVQFSLALIVLGILALGITFLLSRGIQAFAHIFGKEVGSFFDWMFGGLLKKMGFEKKKKEESQK